MFLNVFNAVLPVLNMTTQDANTEISKLFFFQTNFNLKNRSQLALGFCAAVSVREHPWLAFETQNTIELVFQSTG